MGLAILDIPPFKIHALVWVILVWIAMHYRNENYLIKLLPVSIVNNDDHDNHDQLITIIQSSRQ